MGGRDDQFSTNHFGLPTEHPPPRRQRNPASAFTPETSTPPSCMGWAQIAVQKYPGEPMPPSSSPQTTTAKHPPPAVASFPSTTGIVTARASLPTSALLPSPPPPLLPRHLAPPAPDARDAWPRPSVSPSWSPPPQTGRPRAATSTGPGSSHSAPVSFSTHAIHDGMLSTRKDGELQVPCALPRDSRLGM